MKLTQPGEISGCLLGLKIYPSALMFLGRETRLSLFLFSMLFFLNFLRCSYINPKMPLKNIKNIKQQLDLRYLLFYFIFSYFFSLCFWFHFPLFIKKKVPWSLKIKNLILLFDLSLSSLLMLLHPHSPLSSPYFFKSFMDDDILVL